MKTSAQLELETEARRTQVAANLAEMKERLRPSTLTDEVLSYAGGQTGELMANFGRQIARNPVPAALIGAGIAWLVFGRDSGRGAQHLTAEGRGNDPQYNREHAHRMAEGAGHVMHDIGERASDMYEGAKDAVRGAASAVTDAVRDAASSVTDTAAAVGDKVQDTASTVAHKATSAAHVVGDTAEQAASAIASGARSAAQFADRTTHDAKDFLKDQPFVVLGLGLAVGSLIGALIPRTELEDRLLGETADDIKQQAGELASEGLDTAAQIGERVLDKAADETAWHVQGDKDYQSRRGDSESPR